MRLCLLLSVLFAFGCSNRRANESECKKILERIVEIELRENGYNDPELAKRKSSALMMRYRTDIARCVGRRLPEDAMNCIADAASTEELSHRCLN